MAESKKIECSKIDISNAEKPEETHPKAYIPLLPSYKPADYPYSYYQQYYPYPYYSYPGYYNKSQEYQGKDYYAPKDDPKKYKYPQKPICPPKRPSIRKCINFIRPICYRNLSAFEQY